MDTRPYRSGDAAALDAMLDSNAHGDVRLRSDRIIVAGNPPVGCLVWRPGGLVHELRVGKGLSRRSIADQLVGTAIADSVAKPYWLREAIFVTDSDVLGKYVEELGAVEQCGNRVYTLELPRCW